MDSIAPGIIPGSDTTHLSILSYDPYEVYTGRDPLKQLVLEWMLFLEILHSDAISQQLMKMAQLLTGVQEESERGTHEIVEVLNTMVLEDYPDIKIILKNQLATSRAVLVLRGETLQIK